MRCHICDRVLGPEEISYSHDHEEFNPCGTCLMEIKEVFGDGDVLTEEEIDSQLELEFEDGPAPIDEDSLSY